MVDDDEERAALLSAATDGAANVRAEDRIDSTALCGAGGSDSLNAPDDSESPLVVSNITAISNLSRLLRIMSASSTAPTTERTIPKNAACSFEKANMFGPVCEFLILIRYKYCIHCNLLQ